MELDEKYAKAKALAESLWRPTHQKGKGAGRGCAHEEPLRKLYYKLLMLRVPPTVLNEVRTRCARARARCPGFPLITLGRQPAARQGRLLDIASSCRVSCDRRPPWRVDPDRG